MCLNGNTYIYIFSPCSEVETNCKSHKRPAKSVVVMSWYSGVNVLYQGFLRVGNLSSLGLLQSLGRGYKNPNLTILSLFAWRAPFEPMYSRMLLIWTSKYALANDRKPKRPILRRHFLFGVFRFPNFILLERCWREGCIWLSIILMIWGNVWCAVSTIKNRIITRELWCCISQAKTVWRPNLSKVRDMANVWESFSRVPYV